MMLQQQEKHAFHLRIMEEKVCFVLALQSIKFYALTANASMWFMFGGRRRELTRVEFYAWVAKSLYRPWAWQVLYREVIP